MSFLVNHDPSSTASAHNLTSLASAVVRPLSRRVRNQNCVGCVRGRMGANVMETAGLRQLALGLGPSRSRSRCRRRWAIDCSHVRDPM